MSKITVSINVAFTPTNPLQTSLATGMITTDFSMDGDAYVHGIQNIHVDEEKVSLMDELTSPGFIFVKNLDSSAIVHLGAAGSDRPTVKIQPGEFAFFRISSLRDGTLRASSTVDNTRMEIWGFEE